MSLDPTMSQQPKPSSDETDASKVEEDKQTQVVDDNANKSISQDPTISQQPEASSDETTTSKVEDDKQTQVVDYDANKSVSQDPPHFSEVTPDPKHEDTDKKEVSNKDVHTPDPKHEDTDRKEVSTEGVHTPDPKHEDTDRKDPKHEDTDGKEVSNEGVHTPDPKHEDTDRKEVSNEGVHTPDPKHEDTDLKDPKHKDTDRKEVSNEGVHTPDPKHEDTDRKEVSNEGDEDTDRKEVSNEGVHTPDAKHEDTDRKEVSNEGVHTPDLKHEDTDKIEVSDEGVHAPDPKHEDVDKKEVSNEDVNEEKNQSDQTKVVEAPQLSDESIPAPEEKDDKQTRVADDDVNNSASQLPQQSDDITSSTAPVKEDKQTKLVDDEANKSVSTKQADEITPDPNQEDGNNADDSADENEPKQLDAGQSEVSLARAQNTTGENESGPVSDDALIVLVRRELQYIRETAKKLNDYGDICEESLKGSDNKIRELDVSFTEATAIDDTVSDEVGREKRIRDVQKEIRIFKKHLRKLKLIIPPKFKVNKDDIPELKKYLSELTQNVKLYTSDNKQILGKLDLFKEKLNHEYKSAFKDFELRYKELDYRMKLCLLCFSAIPEHEVIKKRLMVYWWIGEGFIIPENLEEKKQDLEQLGAKAFDDLLKKQFIYSADGKDSQEVDNCKMLPFVRWAVIYMAQRAKFFEFDHDGSPTEDYSSCFRACLSGNGLDTQKFPDLEKLHMLLNVNEAILELKPEWLLKMRNISILCLGRWQAASEHHIEVEDTKFLQGLKNMIHLRYLSLQGISRITELPNSVSCLSKLTMLDLRACHNLEIIPRDIGLLKLLTYLDLSECYLLTQMPRGLSKLVNLVVLKGFLVVEDTKKEKICTLEDLTKLKKLRKLSIFTGVEAFPGSKDLRAFQNFEVLNKLKIVWGGKKAMKGQSVTGETKVEGGATTGVSNKDIPRKLNSETPANVTRKSKKSSRKPVSEELDSSKLGLPKKLQKLDLQCYPLESAPEWLKPKKLEELKKLYIRGGKLRDLNLTNDNWEVEPWNVETLRLKYLTGLGMNWTELLELFPKLLYLEKVRCTKLTLFPCNDKGVWINKAKLPKKV